MSAAVVARLVEMLTGGPGPGADQYYQERLRAEVAAALTFGGTTGRSKLIDLLAADDAGALPGPAKRAAMLELTRRFPGLENVPGQLGTQWENSDGAHRGAG